MFNKSLITIVIPVYGVEKYIAKCIDNIKKQTFVDYECLIINDGTKDNSVAIAKEIIGNDNRFRIIHKENGGLSSARNLGIEQASGDYIYFIDPDDYISENTLEACYQKIVQGYDIVTFGMKIVDESDGIIKTFVPDVNRYYAEDDIIFAHETINYSACTKLYKKCLFDSVKFPVGKLIEDKAVMHRLFYGKKIALVEGVFYFYLKRGGSIMNSYHPNYIKDFIDIYEDYFSFITEVGWSDKNRMMYERSYILKLYLKLIEYASLHSPNFDKDYKYIVSNTDRDILTALNIFRKVSFLSARAWLVIVFDKSPALGKVLIKAYSKKRGY